MLLPFALFSASFGSSLYLVALVIYARPPPFYVQESESHYETPHSVPPSVVWWISSLGTVDRI